MSRQARWPWLAMVVLVGVVGALTSSGDADARERHRCKLYSGGVCVWWEEDDDDNAMLILMRRPEIPLPPAFPEPPAEDWKEQDVDLDDSELGGHEMNFKMPVVRMPRVEAPLPVVPEVEPLPEPRWLKQPVWEPVVLPVKPLETWQPGPEMRISVPELPRPSPQPLPPCRTPKLLPHQLRKIPTWPTVVPRTPVKGTFLR